MTRQHSVHILLWITFYLGGIPYSWSSSLDDHSHWIFKSVPSLVPSASASSRRREIRPNKYRELDRYFTDELDDSLDDLEIDDDGKARLCSVRLLSGEILCACPTADLTLFLLILEAPILRFFQRPVNPVMKNLARGAFLRVASDLSGGTPLENIKCRVTVTTDKPIQATKNLVNQGGIVSLWSGTQSRTLEGALMGAMFLVGSTATKKQVLSMGGSKTVAALAGGVVGGVVQVRLCLTNVVPPETARALSISCSLYSYLLCITTLHRYLS
jgi:hypothetical protein